MTHPLLAETYGLDAAALRLLPYRELSMEESAALGRCYGRVRVSSCNTRHWDRLTLLLMMLRSAMQVFKVSDVEARKANYEEEGKAKR